MVGSHQFEVLRDPLVADGLPLFGRVPLRLLQDGLLLRGSLLVVILDGLGHSAPQLGRLLLALVTNNWYIE